MKYLIIVLYLSLFSILGCGGSLHSASTEKADSTGAADPSGVVSQPSILRNFDPRLISTLQNEKERSVKLNELLKNVETSTFYVNDHIVFSEEDEKENRDIVLHVQTQCIESKTQKKFTKKTKMDYKNEIMLIELIPERLFSYGSLWWLDEKIQNPTCSFHFEAKNKAGDVHYFELPHLPILSFDNSLNLSLIQQTPPSKDIERVEQFPALKFDQIENYAVISGKSAIVDQLKLICETFDLSFDVDNLIHYDLWKLQGWTSIPAENRVNQPCRFVSFNKNHIAGISQLFPIVFPAQGMTVKIITDVQTINSLKKRYPLSREGYEFNGRKHMKSDFEKDRNLGAYHHLAVLKFENYTIDTVQLYIPQTSFYADVHFFYDNILHGMNMGENRVFFRHLGSFVTMKNAAQFTLTPSLIKAPSQDIEMSNAGFHAFYQDNHILITLEAESVAFIPLSINIEKQCRFKKNWLGEQRMLKAVRNIGMIFEGSLFPIYQVLDITNVDSAQRTIIGSITENDQEQTVDSFRLDIGLDIDRGINKHFYHNTCTSMQISRFDQASLTHPETWKVRSKKNDTDVHFTKDTDHSLSQKQDQLIKKGIQKLLEEQNQR